MECAATIRLLQPDEMQKVGGGLNLEALEDLLVSYETLMQFGFPIGPWTEPLSLCF